MNFHFFTEEGDERLNISMKIHSTAAQQVDFFFPRSSSDTAADNEVLIYPAP